MLLGAGAAAAEARVSARVKAVVKAAMEIFLLLNINHLLV
jgi:hypothetical protein